MLLYSSSIVLVLCIAANAYASADGPSELDRAHAANVARIMDRLILETDKAANRVPTGPHVSVDDTALAALGLRMQQQRLQQLQQQPVLKTQCEVGQSSCCPHVMEVSMDNLGDGFGIHVIAPRKIHSVVCMGGCSAGQANRTRTSRISTTESSSCRPSGYEGQKVIWIDEDEENVIQKTITDFYQVKCSCS